MYINNSNVIEQTNELSLLSNINYSATEAYTKLEKGNEIDIYHHSSLTMIIIKYNHKLF